MFFRGKKPWKSKDHLKNRSSPKIFLVGNLNHPKLGTVILIVFDFQGKTDETILDDCLAGRLVHEQC